MIQDDLAPGMPHIMRVTNKVTFTKLLLFFIVVDGEQVFIDALHEIG